MRFVWTHKTGKKLSNQINKRKIGRGRLRQRHRKEENKKLNNKQEHKTKPWKLTPPQPKPPNPSNRGPHHHAGSMLVAWAMFQVTGPLMVMCESPSLMRRKCRLKSSPQPLESLKSSSMCWPMSRMLALRTSWAPLRSTVVTVIWGRKGG